MARTSLCIESVRWQSEVGFSSLGHVMKTESSSEMETHFDLGISDEKIEMNFR